MNIDYYFKTKSLGTDPKYEEEYFEEEHYEYECSLTIDELIEYLTEHSPKDKKKDYAEGIRLAEEYIDWDTLEDDEEFVDYMKDKHYDEAYEEWLESKDE